MAIITTLCCQYCGKQFLGRSRKYCDKICNAKGRAAYYRQYHIDHKEERLNKCKLRRIDNLSAYREREARIARNKHKNMVEERLLNKVQRDWKVDRKTARKMIEHGSFPP